jgi:hypothetical protein
MTEKAKSGAFVIQEKDLPQLKAQLEKQAREIGPSPQEGDKVAMAEVFRRLFAGPETPKKQTVQSKTPQYKK